MDLPNGGAATITDNDIEKGANAPNWTFVDYSSESTPYPGSSLTISGNTFVSDLPASTSPLILSNVSGRVAATITGNSFVGVPPTGVTNGPNDVVYDNSFVTSVAEPASAGLLGAALVVARVAQGFRQRARRRGQITRPPLTCRTCPVT